MLNLQIRGVPMNVMMLVAGPPRPGIPRQSYPRLLIIFFPQKRFILSLTFHCCRVSGAMHEPFQVLSVSAVDQRETSRED